MRPRGILTWWSKKCTKLVLFQWGCGPGSTKTFPEQISPVVTCITISFRHFVIFHGDGTKTDTVIQKSTPGRSKKWVQTGISMVVLPYKGMGVRFWSKLGSVEHVRKKNSDGVVTPELFLWTGMCSVGLRKSYVQRHGEWARGQNDDTWFECKNRPPNRTSWRCK